MKIIVMNCNVKKENKKAQRKIMKNLFSLKTIKRLKDMDNNEVDCFFNDINSNIESIDKNSLQNMYLNYFIADKKINRNNKRFDKDIQEIACTVLDESDTDSINNYKHLNDGFINTIKNMLNKLMITLNKTKTKRLILSAISIVLTFTCHKLKYAAIPCSTGSGGNIELAFYYIRMISGVVCFIFMTIEIIQNATQGDVKVIWYVVAKYLAITIAILSFRKIFNLIDGVFNGA